ncbi:hypothetical protein ACHFCA_11575 [Delftia tsuruhatensis]
MPDSDSGALPASTLPVIDLQGLGFDAGAHLLVKHALAALPVGGQLRVTGSAPGWQAQLSGWCSDQGHGLRWEDGVDAAQAMAIVARGGAQAGRWRGAAQTGRSDARSGDGAVAAQAQPFWGLAARGAQVEAGAPAFHFRLSDKLQVWTDSASDLYAQAVAAQWNADTDIDWNDAPELPAPVEDAIVQLMTYMVENENAALLVPARFLGQLHPHYRELQAALAIQVADEARHIDVFTRRIRRHGREPALSTAGGQASLKSLLDETDFSVAGFLLSVLGEGTFVHLLQFLQTEAPDPLTPDLPPGRARRGAPCGPGHVPPAVPPAARARLPAPAGPGRGAALRQPGRHLGAERGSLRRPDPHRGRHPHSRGPGPWRRPRAAAHARHGRRPVFQAAAAGVRARACGAAGFAAYAQFHVGTRNGLGARCPVAIGPAPVNPRSICCCSAAA